MKFQSGENHVGWKGDDVGYSGVHHWARKQLPETNKCADCGKKGKTDVANISGKYLRDIKDWERLCRKCHMIKDGRLENSKKTRFKTKFKDKTCPVCGTSFHPRIETRRTDSRSCGQILRRRNTQ